MGVQTERVIKTLEEMQALVKHWPKDPNCENVHRLRTTARRLEAALDLSGLRRKSYAEKIRKAADTLRKSAGKARDLDVMAGLVEKLEPSRAGALREKLVHHIKNKRMEAVEMLNRKIEKHRKRVGRTLPRLGERVSQTTRMDDVERWSYSSGWEKALHRQAAKLMGVRSITRTNAHAFRIHAKKLRDMLVFCDNANKDVLKRLAAAKDTIGEWHDWQELTKLAESELQLPKDRPFLDQLRRIVDGKLRGALRSANQLRSLKEQELTVSSMRKTAPSKRGHATMPANLRTGAI